jgi:H+/Cl- antiporter ClcA
MTPRNLWIFLIFAVFTGLAGRGYSELYLLMSRIFRRERSRNILPKVIIGSIIAGFAAWAVNPYLIGTSKEIVSGIFNPESGLLFFRFWKSAPVILVLIGLAVMKALGNCVTVGSGMSAGFAGPAVIIGMLFGSACGHIFGLSPGSADFSALVAAGFSGMLASTMNIPIAAAVLTIESFGLQYSFPAAVTAIIAFQVNRRETIYDSARSSVPKALR